MFEKSIKKLQSADESLTLDEFLKILEGLYRDVYSETKKYVSLLPVKNENSLVDSLLFIGRYYTLSIYEQNEERLRKAGCFPEIEELIRQLSETDRQISAIRQSEEVLAGKKEELEEKKKELEKKKVRRSELEEECRRLDSDIQELEKITLDELEARKKHLDAVLVPLKETKESLEADIRNSSYAAETLLQDQNHMLKVISGDFSDKTESAQRENLTLQAAIRKRNQDVRDKQSEKERLNLELSVRNTKIADLNKEISALKEMLLNPDEIKKYNSLRDEKNSLEKQVADKRKDTENSIRRLSELKKESEDLSSRNTEAENQITREIRAQEEEKNRSQAAVDELLGKKEELEKSCISLEDSIRLLNTELKELQEKEEGYRSELDSPELKKQEESLENLKERTQRIEELRSSLNKSLGLLTSLPGKEKAEKQIQLKLGMDELHSLEELLGKYLSTYREIQDILCDR